MGLWLAKVVPRSLLRPIFEICGWLYGLLHSSKRKIVQDNLSLLGKRPDWRKSCEVYKNFAVSLADYFCIGALPRKEAVWLLEKPSGFKHLKAIMNAKKGGLILVPYMGLGELGQLLFVEWGASLLVVAGSEPSPELTRWRADFRERLGVETCVAEGEKFSTLPILKAWREGKAVVALIDRPQPTRYNVPVQFPGGTVLFAGGLLSLAATTGCPISVATIYCQPNGRYKAELLKPFFLERKSDRNRLLDEACQKIANLMLPTLKKHPTQWYQFVPLSYMPPD